MKTSRSRFSSSRPLLILLPFALAASALAMAPPAGPAQDAPTVATVRKDLGSMYETWGRARMAVDKETIEKTLAPDFYVLLDGRKISREQFVSDITRDRSDSRLTRFDVEVLTVQPAEDGWTVVITEKIEVELAGVEEGPSKLNSLWITRDGWRKEDGQWLVTYSEAIGYENWMPGTKPPFEDW